MAVSEVSLRIQTHGMCEQETGTWSYEIQYRGTEGDLEQISAKRGSAEGTTARQMQLMAILNSLSEAKSLDMGVPMILESDCEWCIKCITREYDCVSDDEHRRNKVDRGYVQYLQEIWWKISGIDVTFVARPGR
jgi:ribonuclease HI